MPKLIESEIDANDPGFLYLNLHSGEEIKYIVRHHWAGFVSTSLIVLAMAAVPLLALIIIHIMFPNPSANMAFTATIIISAYFLFLLTFLFSNWVNYYYDIVFITTQRMINVNQQGLFSRQTSELSLRQIQDASAEVEGFWRTAFNYGLLVIETAGRGTGEDLTHRSALAGYFTMPDLPDPNRLARLILELHHAEIGNG